MFRSLFLFLATASLCACATTAPITSPSEKLAPGLVSAADPRAAEAGVEMLRAGGSATDAAIAVMLALTVVEPQSSGIGGGGFYLRAGANGKVENIDGRETAPAGAMPEWFMEAGEPIPFSEAVTTGLSVGVPGNLRLAEEAHRRHGRLPWDKLFAPAIALARDGFILSPRLHEFLDLRPHRAGRDPAGRALFFGPDGTPLPAGTLVRNPALAATLEKIARQGPDAFYEGEAARALAEMVRQQTPRSGGMTVADISAYRAKFREPVCGDYRAYRICGMGPPSSGATTVIAILKQLERFDLAGMGSTSPVAWHLFAESQRLAYADRELYLADGDFVDVPVAGLIADDYLAERAQSISPVTRMERVDPGTPDGAAPSGDGAEPEESGTSHFVTIDGLGNAVSYTSTIEGPFGSGILHRGFYLNNELTDFSFVAERENKPVANRVEGGKRPRSSMAPTLVFGPDRELKMALGAAGGSTIPVQVARAIIGIIDWGLDVEQALALPVLFAPGDTLYVEQGSALEDMIPALEELGVREVVIRELPIKTNAALRDEGGWRGAADPRSEGVSIRE